VARYFYCNVDDAATAKLIIHADDVGLNHWVNQETFAAIDEGLVNAASIIANAPQWEPACEGALRRRQVDWGIHLNLTEGRPITESEDLAPILDDAGQLCGGALHRAPFIEASLRRAIFDEWSAQIDRLIAHGVRPGHIDSHHHIHFAPVLFPVLKSLQRKYGVRRLRPPVLILGSNDQHGLARRTRKALWRWFVGLDGRTRMADGCGDLLSIYPRIEARLCNLTFPPAGEGRSFELLVHPGGAHWDLELAALRSLWPKPCDPVRRIA
jgi:predicted glycoside hydrolase/deacetylase ChbG (UPF0249 family)